MLIRIINGTYGHRVGKNVVPKALGDEPFELDDSKAEKLIRNKIAVAVEVQQSQKVNVAEPASIKFTEKPVYDTKTKANPLKALMHSCGLTIKFGMTKEEMIVALDDFFENYKFDDSDSSESGESDDTNKVQGNKAPGSQSEEDSEEDPEENADDGETPPVLNAEDPVE